MVKVAPIMQSEFNKSMYLFHANHWWVSLEEPLVPLVDIRDKIEYS